MSEMQHERIKTLCDSLRFLTVPAVYANLADAAAQEKISYVDYLEAILKSEHDLRQGRSRQTMARRPVFHPSRRWMIMISILPQEHQDRDCLNFPVWPSCTGRKISSFLGQAEQARPTLR